MEKPLLTKLTEFNEVVQDFYEMNGKRERNVEVNAAEQKNFSASATREFVNNSNMPQEDKDHANKCIENKDWTGLYNILDKNDLLGKFMEWMARELQKMAGSAKLPAGGEAQMQYLGESKEKEKQDKAERDLAERVDELRKKYGGKED